MIKVLSNISSNSSTKIDVTSRLVECINGVSSFVNPELYPNSSDMIYKLDYNRFLFVRVSFSGLTTKDDIVSTIFRLVCISPSIFTAFKLYQLPEVTTSFSSLSANDLYGLLDQTSQYLIEKTSISNTSAYSEDIVITSAYFDLLKIIDDVNTTNPTFIFAITSTNSPSTKISVCYLDNFDDEQINAYVISTKGINNFNSYDECSCSSFDKGYINLKTGECTHILNIFKSTSKKMPISISLSHSKERSSDSSFLLKKLKLNYEYDVYLENGIYIIEDYTGALRSYINIPNDSQNEDFIKREINRVNHPGDLYFCDEDYSYIFVQNGDYGGKLIEYYDRNDNYMQFLTYNHKTQLKAIRNELGEEINISWTPIISIYNHILSITNANGDSLDFVYDNSSPYNLTNIVFANEQRKISFSYNNEKYYVSLYSTENNSVILIKQFVLGFDYGYFITSIEERNYCASLMYKFLYAYQDSKVTNVSLYASNNECVFYKNYLYQNEYTKITDYESRSTYYYFDNYGRTRTIMDSQGNVQSFNHNKIKDGLHKGINSKSKVYPFIRNLIDNHSFEYVDNNGDLLGWDRVGNGGFSLTNESPFSNKSLYINTSNNLNFSQEIYHVPNGEYHLKLKAKVLSLSSFTIKVHLYYTILNPLPVSQHYEYDLSVSLTDGEWREFSTTSINIASIMLGLKIVIEIASNGTNQLYLDELYLNHVDSINRYNLISNPYLENVENNLPIKWNFISLTTNEGISALSGNDEHLSLFGRNIMHFASCDTDTYLTSNFMRRMYQNVIVSGQKNEELSFVCFSKCYATENNIFRIFLIFHYDILGSKTYYFDFDKNVSCWQSISGSVLTEDDYEYIVFGVEYNGPRDAYFDAFELCKESFGIYYNYDKRGRLTEIASSNGLYKQIYYENNKMRSIVLQDGNHFLYDYLNDGRIKKISDVHGGTLTFEYGQNDSFENITKTIIRIGNETIVNEYEYDQDDNLIKNINEYNEETNFTYDHLKRLTSLVNPNGFIEEITYDKLSNLLSISGFNSSVNPNPDYKNEASYNYYLDLLSKIKSPNDEEYTFTYDDAGRLLNIKYQSIIIQEFTYNEYSNNVNKNLISSKKYGSNGDIFFFAYDNKDRIIEVKLNNISIYQYEYNENGQTSVIIDLENNNVKYLTYDSQGNLNKVTTDNYTFKYEYDNLNNIQNKVIKNETKIELQSFDYDYEYNDYSKEGFLSRLANNGDEIVVSNHSGKGEYGLDYRMKNYLSSYDNSIKTDVMTFNDKRHLLWYNFDSINANRTSGIINGKYFNLSYWKSGFKYTKSIYFWFKPSITNYSVTNLLKFRDSNQTSPIISSLDIDINGHIVFKDKDGIIKVTTTNLINDDEWNFVCIKLFRSNLQNKLVVRLNDISSNEVTISINPYNIDGIIFSYQPLIPIYPVDSSNPPTYDYSMPISLKISTIGFSNQNYSDSFLDEINNTWRKYFLNQTNTGYKNNSTTILSINGSSNFEYISLNGEIISSSEIKPIYKLSDNDSLDPDKETVFKYDSALMRKVYSNFDDDSFAPLSFALPFFTSGTISFWFNIAQRSNISHNRFIVAIINNDVEVFSIFIDVSSSRICARINGNQNILTGLLSYNSWHNLYFSFNQLETNIYIDGNIYTMSSFGSLNSPQIYFGSSIQKETSSLNGYIENILYSTNSVTFSSNVINNRPITYGETLDNLGRVTSKNIVINNQKYSTVYTYNKTRIVTETDIDDYDIDYDYDEMGNVTYIDRPNSEDEIYEYDKLGRLIYFEKCNQYDQTFTYDSNGNILSIVRCGDMDAGTYTYEYNGDRLLGIKKNGNNYINISYNSNNAMYPNSMTIKGTNQSLTWSGKRLVNIGNDIEYRYNEEGIRIFKRTNQEETTFVLEGNNIISMSMVVNQNTYNFSFHYDIHGFLFGLRFNNKEYFYIRDMLGNILSIIDSNGSHIIYYEYSAFGEPARIPIATSGDDLIVANYNPFMFKGYYYDNETGFYYLKTRYYSPFICRFVSPDDFAYLNVEDLRGINLYTYCGNNPVMYMDPTGHFLILSTLLITIGTSLMAGLTIGIAAGATYALVDQIMQASINKKNWDWDRFGSRTFDVTATVGTIVTSISLGLASSNLLSILPSFIGMNQTINSIYYNHFANSSSSFSDNSYSSGYGYMTRWDRLDYMKTQYGGNTLYDANKMRYYGEFSFHMYGYIVAPFISNFAKADVKTYEWDSDHGVIGSFIINVFSILFGLFGF